MPWFTLLLAAAPAALPCAALVHDVDVLAESDAQEVILWQDGAEAVTEYRVSYGGDADDFGWIIVVPAGFVSLSDGDPERFDALRDETQPAVYAYSVGGEDDAGCGCGGAAKGDALGASNAADTGGGFDVIAEGFTGTYSYTAFSAEDAQGLADALNTLGWPAEGAQASLEAYAAGGGVEYVLVEVRPDVAETDGARTLPPVVLRSTSERLFFPSRMARGASVDEMRTVVWVLGEQRARVSGWAMADLEWVEATGEQTAEQAWESALQALSTDEATWARVHAGPWEGGVVTRFETRAAPAQHVLDSDFHADDGDESQRATVEVWASAADTGASVLLLLGPLLGVGVVARRRSRS
jgi:hypothetical protein